MRSCAAQFSVVCQFCSHPLCHPVPYPSLSVLCEMSFFIVNLRLFLFTCCDRESKTYESTLLIFSVEFDDSSWKLF